MEYGSQKTIGFKEQTRESSFEDCIADLVNHEIVMEMENYRHHNSTSCYEHCVEVSYKTYQVCKRMGLDYQSAARGALLHDLFLYDWRTEKLEEGRHAFVHADIALRNAREEFTLNAKEEDVIKKHMWPVTLAPPRYLESFIVSFVDKYCAFTEFLKNKRKG
ncbi:MAG TPA: HD family phosphohydrolase [Eubacteriaceae bacterium]|nr:HD family phosphohydrolase [Eubacteriaceae bacterium]